MKTENDMESNGTGGEWRAVGGVDPSATITSYAVGGAEEGSTTFASQQVAPAAQNLTPSAATGRVFKGPAPEPSKVVHLRSFNPQASESEVLDVFKQFGTVAYVMIIPAKKMAFVEFDDISASEAVMRHARTATFFFANQPCSIEYSRSKSIQRPGVETADPTNVLAVTVKNVLYPISLEIVHHICKQHGDVRRILALQRSNMQFLVEFDTVETAKKAKYALNGADIYANCCSLHVEYANSSRVNVKENNNEGWDFTVNPTVHSNPVSGSGGIIQSSQTRAPLLGAGSSVGGTSAAQASMSSGLLGGQPAQQQQQYWPGYSSSTGSGYTATGQGVNTTYAGAASSMYSGSGYTSSASGYGSAGTGSYAGGGASPANVVAAAYNYLQQGSGSAAYTQKQSAVMMVYGIVFELMNCDKLFNLLCLYGDPEKIRFMKSKQDTAMVQMGDSSQIEAVCNFLSGTKLYGQELTFRPSHQQVFHDTATPFLMADNTPSFKDYTGSRNLRFPTPELAAKNRLVKPCKELHWYNAPGDIDESKIKNMFEEDGSPEPIKICALPNKSDKSSTGLLEFSTTDEAVEAVVQSNHHMVDTNITISKAPYCVKLAFATLGKKRPFDSDSAVTAHPGLAGVKIPRV